MDHPVDEELELAVIEALPPAAFQARRKQVQAVLEEYRQQVFADLPIFYMEPGTRAGTSVRLHLHEPRYKTMIKRVWDHKENNHLFVYCASSPVEGQKGTVVYVRQASYRHDGCADIYGIGLQEITLGTTWVEHDCDGLYYTRVQMLSRNLRAQRSVRMVVQISNDAARPEVRHLQESSLWAELSPSWRRQWTPTTPTTPTTPMQEPVRSSCACAVM